LSIAVWISPVQSSQPTAPQFKPITRDQSATLTLINRQGATTQALTDGDRITLKITLDRPAEQPIPAVFELDTAKLDTAKPLAACTIPQGETSCETKPLLTLGWYWSEAGQPQPNRRIYAKLASARTAMSEVGVAARPVVLVHGFLSDADSAWGCYTRSTGFLGALGLKGYAVGDGQFEGVMRTGDPKFPAMPTQTIAENAQTLKQYIAQVKQTTGAEQVDLVAHSMGGLISRYYIDRLMPQRDVAQLIMLGSPHGGSDCASLPASLGFYLPAALELRPSYLREIFNPQITHRRGVAFHLFAGTPIVESFKAPCTDVPSDLVVGLDSVSVIGTAVTKLPYLHTDLTTSAQVFQDFVAPLLKQQAGQFQDQPDPTFLATAATPTQFTRVFTGHVAAGSTQEVTIHLSRVTIASFALFDPTHSLSVSVRGASGKIIPLDPVKNGFITIDDPASLIHLGYGFSNPRPGAWKVTLISTAKTPPQGTDYAIAAKVIGDTNLHAQLSQLLPQLNQTVTLSGHLDLANQPLKDAVIQATLHRPNGKSETLSLTGNGPEKQANWKPKQPGIYGIDVTAQATVAGSPIERTTFLTAEVQPPASKKWGTLLLLLTPLPIGWLLLKVKQRRRHAHLSR
jgi:pimeloyl-ACP methyl ester carboxylesterase